MKMHPMLLQALEAEMTAAMNHYYVGNLQPAFSHLERAHILGQSFPIKHARVHWWMLKIGWKRRDVVEIAGQLPRIVGSLLFSRVWVPKGNTGGARVPPFKSMPIPQDLQGFLEKCGRGYKAD
jgi:hypothetical protein